MVFVDGKEVSIIRQRFRLGLWLNKPIAFTVCSPLITVASAATTIFAPMLLDPEGFGQFALLLSIYQYVSDFDLGLSRLSDQLLTRSDTDQAVAIDELLWARTCVAIGVATVAVAVGIFAGLQPVIAALAGLGAMLSNGPIATYRARSHIVAFTLSATGIQFGMTLPRLIGLLAGGVRGCFIACATWNIVGALILYAPFVRRLQPVSASKLFGMFLMSSPLFVLSSAWMVYLLASRWFSWLLVGSTKAGLFALGANLVLTGLGVVNTVAQAYYPRHLIYRDQRRLTGELVLLLAGATTACLFADLFCRFELRHVFPRFGDAGASTAAILFSAIPLGLCTWIIPLIVVQAERPFRDASIFGVSLIMLFGLMAVMGVYGDIEGQAWACVLSGIILLGFQLHIVVRNRLLDRSTAIKLWLANLAVQILCALVWHFTFY